MDPLRVRRSALITFLVGGVVGCGFDPPAPTEELPKVSFVESVSITDESITNTEVHLKLSMLSAKPVTVSYEATSGRSTLAGGHAEVDSDFGNAKGEVTFQPLQTTAVLTLSIKNDGIEEPEEDIHITLKPSEDADLGEKTEHTLLISSKLLPRVRFVATTSSAGEDKGVQNFAVQLDQLAPVDVVVRYTWAGTAEPTDHGLVDGYVTIPVGQLSQSLLASIQDDPTDEDDETIDVDLIAQAGAVIAPALGKHVHTIVDNDLPPTIGFAPAASTTGEAGTANLAVTLSLASEKPITVDYLAAAGGTASADDFSLTPGTLTFAPGTTSMPVPVTITSDVLDENNETARFSIANAVNATLVAATTLHTLTINDDDAPPTIEFQAATSTAAEGTATHAVTVKLSAPSGLPIQFSVAQSGGSATAADITVPATPFTIPPGATTASFNVTVIDDAIDEDDETATLTLGGLVNASPGPQASHTITITDNDNGPLVRFDTGTPDRSALEQDIQSVTYVYRVVLSAASAKQVTVQVAISGTAENNDYSIGTGDIPVVFPPGQTSRDIRVTVNADGQKEQNETVTLTLGTVTNGSNAGDNQTRTHTIIDDD